MAGRMTERDRKKSLQRRTARQVRVVSGDYDKHIQFGYRYTAMGRNKYRHVIGFLYVEFRMTLIKTKFNQIRRKIPTVRVGVLVKIGIHIMDVHRENEKEKNYLNV